MEVRPKKKSERVAAMVYELVQQIPYGKVMTYGQIADHIPGCTARMAGHAMAAVPENSEIPWQRVINSQGKISPRANGVGADLQEKRLSEEGVEFQNGKLDLKRYRWEPEEYLEEHE